MAKGYNLGDLRAAIDETFLAVSKESETGEAPNEKVIGRLKADRSDLIKVFEPQLVDIALTKLLNEVCQKRTKADSQLGQGNLFSGYGKIPKRVTIIRGLKKETAHLTIGEAKKWLEDHSKRVVENDNEDFEKLVADCEKHAASDKVTISDALVLMRKSKPTQPNLPMSGRKS